MLWSTLTHDGAAQLADVCSSETKLTKLWLPNKERSRALVMSNILIIYSTEIQDVQVTGTWENWERFCTYRHKW